VEDYNIKESLTTGARNTGELSSEFMGTAKALVGNIPDDKQKVYIDAQHDKVSAQVASIIDAVNKTLAQATKDGTHHYRLLSCISIRLSSLCLW
jgi:hypothetical protein